MRKHNNNNMSVHASHTEPGRRADGSSAEPLATLTARATQTMLDVHGLRIKMIEKPFHVTTRDDPAILEIVKGLAHPLDPADRHRRRHMIWPGALGLRGDAGRASALAQTAVAADLL